MTLVTTAILVALPASAHSAMNCPQYGSGTAPPLRNDKPANYEQLCVDYQSDASIASASASATSGSATAAVRDRNIVQVTYVPAAGYAGPATVTVQVTASNGVTGTFANQFSVGEDQAPICIESFEESPPSDAPTLDGNIIHHVHRGEPLSVKRPCYDNDFQDVGTLSYVLSEAPAGATAEGETVNYAPPAGFEGVATWKLTASDGKLSTSRGFDVHVSDNVLCEPEAPTPRKENSAYTRKYGIEIRPLCSRPLDTHSTVELVPGAPPSGGRVKVDGRSVLFFPKAGVTGLTTFALSARLADGSHAGPSIEQAVELRGASGSAPAPAPSVTKSALQRFTASPHVGRSGTLLVRLQKCKLADGTQVRVRLRAGRRTIGRGTRTIGSEADGAVRIKLTRFAKAKLKRGALRATLTVGATGADGKAVSVQRRLKLS